MILLLLALVLDPLVLPVLPALPALLALRLPGRATPLLDSMPRHFSSRASIPHPALVIGVVEVVVPAPAPALGMIPGSLVCHTLPLRVGSRLDKASHLELRARGTTLGTLQDPMDRRVRQVPRACPVLLRRV